jgi:ubiquinone/menaquinone biosynthesis C-methylase UbiE
VSASSAVSFDQIASRYDQTREPPPKELVDSLFDELKQKKSVCDFGAGTGRFARALEDKCLEVTCVDISPKMLALAKKRGLSSLILADLRALPFRDRAFEAGYVFSVLHLVREYREALSEITRVLNGALISAYEENSPKDIPSHLILYAEKLKKNGIEPRGATEGGKFLREQPYIKKVEVNSKQETLAAEQIVDRLKNRISSVTWDAPEEVHKEIIREIEEELDGKTWEFTSKDFLVIYDARALSQSVRRER